MAMDIPLVDFIGSQPAQPERRFPRGLPGIRRAAPSRIPLPKRASGERSGSPPKEMRHVSTPNKRARSMAAARTCASSSAANHLSKTPTQGTAMFGPNDVMHRA
jgi:hypothetical protein